MDYKKTFEQQENNKTESARAMDTYGPGMGGLDSVLFNLQTLFNRFDSSVSHISIKTRKLLGEPNNQEVLKEQADRFENNKIGEILKMIDKCYTLAQENERSSNRLDQVL